MCGIVGFQGVNLNIEEGLNVLHQMNQSIVHRGPDDHGEFFDGAVGLGMRRLSIIDIHGGHQPLFSKDKMVVVVFNGEIYNYRQLRDDLIKLGYQFKTQTDTEVILNQYIEDGENCLHKLNGMFSFAIWDKRKKSLFIARDRMGVKPFYYYWDEKKFIFGSEIKALISSNLIDKSINQKGIWDYLSFRYIPEPNTIWKNIYKLPPAHKLVLQLDRPGIFISRYWDIPKRGLTEERKNYCDYVREFEYLFLDAVEKRMVADVPVGVLLSGGLDSSAVAAAASEVSHGKLNTYSIAFSNSKETNELEYSRSVANYLGTAHHEIQIGKKEFIDFLPQSIYLLDEPMADMASIPLYFVSKLAAKDVKVVLSGEGADEVLGGYNFNKAIPYWNLVQGIQGLPKGIRTSLMGLLGESNPKYQRLGLMIDQSLMGYLSANPPNMTNYMTSSEKMKLFGSKNSLEDSSDPLRIIASKRNSNDPLDLSLYLLSQSWLVEDLLMKADKMTMGASIELRVPFLDYRLVEWAFKAPQFVKVGKSGFMIGKHESKRVLRDFAKSRIPEEIIKRPKQGFPVPVYGWTSSGDMKLWMEDKLLNRTSKLRDIFDTDELEIFVKKSQEDGMYGQQKLWNLAILEIWLEQWQ